MQLDLVNGMVADFLFFLRTARHSTYFRNPSKIEENKGILAPSNRSTGPLNRLAPTERANGLCRRNREGMRSRFSLMHNSMEFDLIAFGRYIGVPICRYVGIPNWKYFGVFHEQNIWPF